MKTYTSLYIFILCIIGLISKARAQQVLTRPMDFMTWNYFRLNINEDKIKTLADTMVEKGLVKSGYNYQKLLPFSIVATTRQNTPWNVPLLICH